MHEHDQEYLNLSVVDLKGIVVASSRLKQGVDLSSRYHFREVFRTGRFAAGNFIISAFDAKPSMAFAMPIMDADNRITGAIGAVVTMDRYAVLFENFSLPEDATLGILDMDGVRMFFLSPQRNEPCWRIYKSQRMDRHAEPR